MGTITVHVSLLLHFADIFLSSSTKSSILALSNTIMSLKDLPYSHFKVAVEELNHRYKVCVALGSLVEEVSEVGSSAGKSLSKLGAPSFQTGNHQWLPTCSVALESIYKMTTTSSGKQLVGHSSNLSQNISKTFPEHVRLGKKRVGAIASKIANQVDEYKKAKALHAKNYEKYLRLAADTEAAIKSRVAANDAEARNSGEKEPQVVQGDNFMNRSLNKMLSKIAPEKKLDDKCKDMVRELDLNERAVVASNKKLIVMRGDLLNEISKTMVELEELEAQRLALMKEGLSRFCLAADLIANQQGEVIASVLERTDRLVAVDEAALLMREIDRPVNAPNNSPLKKRSDSSDTEGEDPDTSAELTVLFSKAEKLGEAIDYFRSLVVRATNSMLEVAEADATYSRSAQKVLDRHGYCRNAAAHWVYAADYSTIPMLVEVVPMKSAPLSAAIGAVGATTLSLTSNLRSAEFLSRFESPDTKAGWEHVVDCLGNFSDLQMRTSEVVGDEVCQQLELVTQRLEIGRKELTEKLAQNTKMVDSARQEVKKVSVKLTKCQALLRERRDTVKQVKDILIVDSMDTGASTDTPSTAAAAVLSTTGPQDNTNDRDAVGSPESTSVLGSTLDEPLASPVPLAVGDSYSRKQGIFRKGGLKQVVGLETQADRVSRIEKQVFTLEEEERDLLEALATAEQALLSVLSIAKAQVLPIFDATREFISTDLVTVKSTIKALMNWKSEALTSSRNANRLAKTAHDELNLTKDLSAFVTAVQTYAKNLPKEQAMPTLNTQMANALQGLPLTLLDVPELDSFQIVQSELITQEREVINRMAPVPSTLYSISNLAMNYAGQSDSSSETSPGPGGYSVFKTRDRKGTEDSISSTHGMAAAAVDTSMVSDSDATSTANDGFHQPVPLDSAGVELAKFGLGPQDKVLESYSCALYPKKGMLAHGRMFVTQHYLAFSGWPDTRVLLLIRNIAEVERMNTLYYVPNALSVKMDDESEYFFGSFIDRELCYALLVNLSEVGRRTANMPDFDETTERRALEFGYQTQNNLFGGGEEVTNTEDGVPAASGSPGVRASPGGFRSASPSALVAAMQGSVTPAKTVVAEPSPTRPATRSESASAMIAKLTSSVRAAPVTPAKEAPAPSSIKPVAMAASPAPVSVAPAPAPSPAPAPIKVSVTQSVDTSSSLSSNTSETAASTASSAPPVVKVVKPMLPEWVEVEDGVDQNALFERNNISVMQEKVFSLSCEEIWAATWAHCNSHAGFLLEEGELDITFTEWVPCTSPKVPEDVAKLSYCFTRQLNYNHPRTTMLMFGPKNAPTGQVQYLYLPIGSKKLTASELTAARPSRGVVFQLTTLQGIPMCDVFKICQYWSFTRHGGEVGRTEMKIGMAIHYMKSTMFKAQIYGGTKEELTIMSLKWLQYAEKCCLNKAAVLPADIITEEQVVQTTEPGSGEKVQVRRSSFRRSGSPGPVGITAAATATAASFDVSVGTNATAASSTAAATSMSTPSALKAVMTVAPTTKSVAQTAQHPPRGEFALQMHVDVNYVLIILACTVLILLVLLYRQSSYNSALVQQINLLSRKIDLSQTAMEISQRQSQSVVQKMEAFINNMQK